MLKKVLCYCFAIYFIFSIICGCVLQSRLGQYMDECEHYRIELEAATDRQSEITEVVGHTSCILSETVNSVAELREQLKAVEDDYNRLYSICFGNGDTIHNGEE